LCTMSTARALVPCRCACGTERKVLVANLFNGRSTSCGHCGAHSTHGMIKSPEYQSWTGMKGRCHNDKNPGYHRYGGRGIKVCKRWRDSFENFLVDVGRRPTPHHTLDRFPDNDGDYKPGNVRWATKLEQSQNTRLNVNITFKGKTRCISEWARVVGLNQVTLSRRLRHGWSIKRALTTPSRQVVQHAM
jgi:hypothetical protein